MSLGACLVLAASCTDVPTGLRSDGLASPTLAGINGLATADISGAWTYHEEATFLLRDYPGDERTGVKAFRCSSDGVYTFVQSGSDFSGSYDQVGTCAASDGTSFPNDFTGVAVTGNVQARHLDFSTADGCRYEAAVQGATLNAISGSGICGAIQYGATYRATFTAVR